MPRLVPRPVIENPTLDAARRYLDKGWVIMPIWGTRGGVCACRRGKECDRPAKHPVSIMRNDRWTWDRITDKSRAERVWGVSNPPNIGICTGPSSGIWVLDVDAGGDKQGWVSLHELQVRIGDLPDTYTVMTGSGGAHFYFTWPGNQEVTNSNRNLPDDLDVRGKGGFVVAPPSVSTSGPYYAVDEEEAEPVESPKELLIMLKPEDRSPRVGSASTGREGGKRDPQSLDRYAESVLDAEVAKLRSLQGSRSGWNNGVFQAACNMLEISNADWNSFTEREVLALVRKNLPTPTDGKPWYPETQIEGAIRRVGSNARPEPL